MKITKFGHCCLLIEENSVRILTDPGNYTAAQQENLDHIDIVLITHEHGDHLHVESVEKIIARNPGVTIVSNSAVAKLLSPREISIEILEGQSQGEFKGVKLEAQDAKHAEVFEEYGQVQNTGYFIAGKLFYPGDALHEPGRVVDTLAFPTAGIWANIKESLNYVLAVKPKQGFPVHDGAFKSMAFLYGIYQTVLSDRGVKVILPDVGREFEV